MSDAPEAARGESEPAVSAQRGRLSVPGFDRLLVNGLESAAISPLDRGAHFGDGLFETIACRSGRARFLALHLERLMQGCSRLRIPYEDLAATRAEIEKLARECERALIKVLVTRGQAVARGYGIAGTEKAMRITIRYTGPQEEPACQQDGVMVRTLALRLGENPLLAGLKHCNRLEQILAHAEYSQSGAAEGILFSSTGRLVSGTMSNVFIVRGSTLLTPLIDRCGVAGVMRRVIIREAGRTGIPVRECELGAADLQTADEMFLTNARVGIWPVRALDERTLGPGPITRRLQKWMTPLLEEPADA